MKTKIFLSHASEDKSFARPLSNVLKKAHDVWYDEYALNVGESIFESISRNVPAVAEERFIAIVRTTDVWISPSPFCEGPSDQRLINEPRTQT